VRVLTFGLSPVIRFGLCHPRKKEWKLVVKTKYFITSPSPCFFQVWVPCFQCPLQECRSIRARNLTVTSKLREGQRCGVLLTNSASRKSQRFIKQSNAHTVEPGLRPLQINLCCKSKITMSKSFINFPARIPITGMIKRMQPYVEVLVLEPQLEVGRLCRFLTFQLTC